MKESSDKSSFSKNVLELSPLPNQQKLPGGQQQEQPGGVQHDQQPITFRRVSQSDHVEIKIEYLYPIPKSYNLVPNRA